MRSTFPRLLFFHRRFGSTLFAVSPHAKRAGVSGQAGFRQGSFLRAGESAVESALRTPPRRSAPCVSWRGSRSRTPVALFLLLARTPKAFSRNQIFPRERGVQARNVQAPSGGSFSASHPRGSGEEIFSRMLRNTIFSQDDNRGVVFSFVSGWAKEGDGTMAREAASHLAE